MFSEPEHVVEQLGLRENDVIVDFGCGGGAYTLASAKALKGKGKVYAVDVQKDILTRLQHSVQDAGLGGVVDVIWGNLELVGGTKMHDGAANVAIVANMLFQNDNKKTILEEAKRVLTHGGKLLIVDWSGSFHGLGPRPQHVFPESDARTLAESLNFSFERHIDAGPHHYGMLFVKGMYHPQTTP